MGEDEKSETSPRSRRWWLGGAVVIVLALVVWGVLAVATGGSGEAADDAAGATPTPSAQSGDDATPSEMGEPTPVTTAPTPTPSAPSVTKPAPVAAAPKPVTVDLQKSAPLDQGVTVRVVKSEAVDGTANGPGEIAGPAVRFTIEIKNASGKPVDMGSAVVNAYYGSERTPASPLSGPGVVAFPTSVAAGATAQATVVFAIPAGSPRDQVSVEYFQDVEIPTVLFVGAVPNK